MPTYCEVRPSHALAPLGAGVATAVKKGQHLPLWGEPVSLMFDQKEKITSLRDLLAF